MTGYGVINHMEINMTDHKLEKNIKDKGKLTARMSVFAWVICALLGWTFALTSFYSLTSPKNDEVMLTAESGPNSEAAAKMENIRPAAGTN